MARKKYAPWLAAIAVSVFAGMAWMLWPAAETEPPQWPDHEPTSSYSTLGRHWQQPVQTGSNANTLSATGVAPPNDLGNEDNAGASAASIDLDQLQHALAHIAVDEQGRLIFDEVALASLRRAFEQFSELSDPAMVTQLKRYVEAGLAGETGAQAAAMVGDYFRYREAKASAEALWEHQENPDPRQRLEQLAELRRQHLGPAVANQLYGGEQAHQRYLLALAELRRNPDLAETERQQLRAQLRSDLRDGKFLVDDRGTDAIRQLANDSQHWQEQGLTEDTRHYLQDQTLGLVSARSLATSQQQKNHWQQRYDQFSERRDTILRSGLTDPEKVRQIDQLLGNHFSGDELEAARTYLPPHMRQ